ncbi:hydrogenase expression/formation protein HypC [Sinosporangium album]|uniref:Hydrogenase expression/formation protein HypC n=1 Tax=Sinosporangium album TaxID=504805 RepID=A0A1G8HHQ2_9ACTN|nr:HypC/HybG/HupF family hydrogenase formation chaperone [Sinosporangium album]SDI06178.1 hydrogenase expression/formation protein HypC [Sinosporangium album]
MCLGIPGEIIEIDPDQPDLATVEVSGVRRAINVGLLSDERLTPGDWILIHVGFALSKIDEEEARSAMAFLESIGQAYEDEIAALRASTLDASPQTPAAGTTEGSEVAQRGSDGVLRGSEGAR